jgi:MFS family permease
MATPKHTAAELAVATGFLLFAVGLALLTFFSATSSVLPYYMAVVLLAFAVGLYTFAGLTWETASHYPVKKGRAFAYGLACLAMVLGAGLAVVSFLVDGFEISAALGIKMALILPGICALVFLVLTESDRHKPWMKALVESEAENSLKYQMNIVDPVKAARFGVACAGLWILAVAVFLALGFAISFGYSWLAFVFALAIQMFMTMMIFGRRE